MARNRWRTAAFLVVISMLATGCGSQVSSDPAQEVVTEFFAMLESGEIDGIAGLLTEDSGVTPAALDTEFYAASVAFPTDATIISQREIEPGVTSLRVSYLIAGEERNMSLGVVESNGAAKIELGEVPIRTPRLSAPGAFEVNGSLLLGDWEEDVEFTPLPGLYSFEYVDPHGFGTVDPDGAPTRPFDVEFPINRSQLEAAVPPGVDSFIAIAANPRLLESVVRKAEAHVERLTGECSATGLVGDVCPSALAEQIAARGDVDRNSIVWDDQSTQFLQLSVQWQFEADYLVSFRYADGSKDSIATSFRGVLASDNIGNPVLEENR